MTPPFPPPKGIFTAAHFQVIQEASADFVQGHVGREANAAFGRPPRQGMLHALRWQQF
jgi:hypothetical protein